VYLDVLYMSPSHGSPQQPYTIYTHKHLKHSFRHSFKISTPTREPKTKRKINKI